MKRLNHLQINHLAYSDISERKLSEYLDELITLENSFTQYQYFMNIVFENVVEREQRNQFIDQSRF